MPAAWAERVAETATRARDFGLLAALAARPDTPVDLIGKLAEHSDAKVRVAALKHPALPEKIRKRVLAGESRTAVLCPLLETDPSRYLERGVECFTAKPTASLGRTLLLLSSVADRPGCVGWVPEPVLELVAETLLAKVNRLGYEETAALNAAAGRLLLRNPDLALRCLQGTGSSGRALELIGTPGLSAATRVALIDNGLNSRAEGRFLAYRIRDIALRLNQAGDAQPEVLDALLQALNGRATTTDEAALEAAWAAVSACGKDDSSLEMLRAAASGGSQPAVLALLMHGEVGDEEKITLLNGDAHNICAELGEHIGKLSVKVREHLAHVDQHGFIAAGGLKTFCDPEAAKLRILKLMLSYESNKRPSYWTSSDSLTWVTVHAPELFKYLPWELVRSSLTRVYRTDPEVGKMIVDLTATLSTETWETFLHLGDSWQGTVGELIEAAGQL